MNTPELQAKRVVLRAWRDEDREPFAEINADPRVCEHLLSTASREYSDAMAARIEAKFALWGYGLWALEVPGIAPFAGFVGLQVPPFEASFQPCVEIGWRLASSCWGKGYVSEAARAALTFAFASLELDEVVSMTVPANVRSQAVMTAIGMTRDLRDDFENLRMPEGHRLRPHVLYRLTRARWRELTRSASVGPSVLERARAFAAALDADDFERARPFLAAECEYEIGDKMLVGPNAILRSYADATRGAHARFEQVRYESAVELEAEREVKVLYTDVLRLGEREHRHRAVQRLTFGREGRIERIAHEPLAGEGESLAAFERG